MTTRKTLFVLALVASLFFGACGGTAALTPSNSAPATPAANTTTFNAPVVVDGASLGLPNADPYVVGANGEAHKLPLACQEADQIETVVGDPESPDFGATITYCASRAQEGVTWKDVGLIGVTALTPLPGDEILAVVVTAGKVVGIWVAATTATMAAGRLIDTMARHTDPGHNPNLASSMARVLIANLLGTWSAMAINGGGPNRDRWCSQFRIGEKILSFAIWVKNAAFPEGGYLSVFDPANTQAPWVTSYPSTLQKVSSKTPSSLGEGVSYDKDVPCPPPGKLPPLQAAY